MPYEAVLETKTHLTRSRALENGLSTMSQLLASTGDRPNRLSGEMENREDDDGSVGCYDVGDGNGNGRKRSAAAATTRASESGGEIIDLLDSSSDEENNAANPNDGNNEIIELLDRCSSDDDDDEVASQGEKTEGATTTAATSVKPKKKKRKKKKKKKARFGKGVTKTRGITMGDRVRVSSEGPKNLRDKEAACRGVGGTQSNPVVLLLLDDGKKSSAPLTTCSVVSIGIGGGVMAPRQPAPYGHGRGRSATLPAWMATGGSTDGLGSADVAGGAGGGATGGGASTAAAATSSALAVPPILASHAGTGGAAGASVMPTMPYAQGQLVSSSIGVAALGNGSSGGGRGRGRAQTLPAWMTNSGGLGPSSSLPTDVNSVQAEPPSAAASASAESNHSQPTCSTVVGAFNSAVMPARGRGRAKTLPAWMTTGASATNATATSTDAPTSLSSSSSAAATTTKTSSSGRPQLHVGQYFAMNALAVDGLGDQSSARNDDELFFIDRKGEEEEMEE